MRKGAVAKLTRVLLWAPTMTFSSTVSRGKSARFWNVRAIPSRAMPWAGTSRISWSLNSSRPLVGW